MPEAQPKYDPFKQACVSHRDLYNMFSEDGPTRANMLCLMMCLQFGFHKKDTRRAPTRVAPGAGLATHDNVVSEVMNRIGPAINDSITRAINAAMGGLTPVAPEDTPVVLGGGNGGGNGDDTIMEPERAEPPPVPAGYGNPNYVGKSEVSGAAEDVTPDTFEGIPLAENTTQLKTEPQPVPLTADELAALREKIAE